MRQVSLKAPSRLNVFFYTQEPSPERSITWLCHLLAVRTAEADTFFSCRESRLSRPRKRQPPFLTR